jgi:hypothetical protein
MATEIQIASNALILIGDNPISSFTEPGFGATAAANLYEDTYLAALSEHPWTFALKEQKLSKLSQSPDPETGFQNAFQVPVDTVRIWAVFPFSNYTIVGDLLYSNQNELLMRYNHKPPETELPPHFVKSLEYKLAADFSISVTEDLQKHALFEQKAVRAFATARSIDSQGKPPVPIIDSPFVAARLGGSDVVGGGQFL